MDKKVKSKIFHYNLFPKNCRGTNILKENIIFIVLNLVFLSILMVFIFSKMQNAANLEEMYAKQIALMIDAAREDTTIQLDMQDGFDVAGEEYSGELVFIRDNIITVKLREKGGYSYSFFNDIKVRPEIQRLNGGYNFYIYRE